MKRGLLILVALSSVESFAQDDELPSRAAPEDFVASPRVHLRAHEDLDPDRLRQLARPGVTLWLATRSNTLRTSTVENVARFDTSWVQLRPPLKSVDARVFAKLPSTGVWLHPEALELVGRLPGARRIAVWVHGSLDNVLVSKLRAVRASEVRWRPEGPADLLLWSQVPGRRVIAATSQDLVWLGCEGQAAGKTSIELEATLLPLSSEVLSCRVGTRLVVEPQTEGLQAMLIREPSMELVLEVGADSARAAAARALLDRLHFGPAR